MELYLSSTSLSKQFVVLKINSNSEWQGSAGSSFSVQVKINRPDGGVETAQAQARLNSPSELMLALPNDITVQLAQAGNELFVEWNGLFSAVPVPDNSLLRTNRRDLNFFIHQVRSPGSRKFDVPTTLFLAEEAYGWLPNDRGDKISALVVMIYRLLDQPALQTAEQNTWLEQQVQWHLENSNGVFTNVDSRWGYSLRIAYFYWLLAHKGHAEAEAFMLNEHSKISASFSMESVPNFFKMGLVLGTFALIKASPQQVRDLLEAMNTMLRQEKLWTTPVNFFQSLDRKNLIANYHEVYKLAIMLEPVRLKREWVSEHDMCIDTTFIGDPGRQLVRKLLQEHQIKYK